MPVLGDHNVYLGPHRRLGKRRRLVHSSDRMVAEGSVFPWRSGGWRASSLETGAAPNARGSPILVAAGGEHELGERWLAPRESG